VTSLSVLVLGEKSWDKDIVMRMDPETPEINITRG